jgi:hypothetical protein
MEFLKEEGALLKEPSGSTFILLMSDWPETSRDIFRVCWHLELVARREAAGGASPARRALLAPWPGMLINLLDTNPLNDLDSGKNIPTRDPFEAAKSQDRLIAKRRAGRIPKMKPVVVFYYLNV